MCSPHFYWQIWLFRTFVIVKNKLMSVFYVSVLLLMIKWHNNFVIPQHFDNVVTSFYHQKDDRHKKLVSISFVQKNANVGKGWFQPKQSGIQQLSHKSHINIVCLLNWYRAVKKFKSTCISLADNEYNVVGGFGTHSRLGHLGTYP